jgi:hypothetical protein
MENQTSPDVTWTASKTLVQKFDIDITGGEACWIKYRTWSYEKKKKKKKKNLIHA